MVLFVHTVIIGVVIKVKRRFCCEERGGGELAVFLQKMNEMHQMHDSRIEEEPSQGTDIF